LEKLPFLTAILDRPDKFCSGVAEILVEVGKILAGVWTGIDNVFDKLKLIIEVLAVHHALPQILVFLFLTAVLHHFHN
jgi:hypothetical protein